MPLTELRKNEKFLKILPEINNGITEKRIDALKEIINHLDSKTTKLYDKMSIKKFFLDNWGVPVINYDEKKLIKNQIKDNKRKNDCHNRYTLSVEERAEAYKNVGVFDEDQIKMLNLIKQTNKKHRKKVVTKEEIKHLDNLDDKYNRLEGIFKMKKNNKKIKKDEKEFLAKKVERNVIKGDKNKKKNKKIKDFNNDIKEDESIGLNEFDEEYNRELFQVDDNIKKKLLQYKKK